MHQVYTYTNLTIVQSGGVPGWMLPASYHTVRNINSKISMVIYNGTAAQCSPIANGGQNIAAVTDNISVYISYDNAVTWCILPLATFPSANPATIATPNTIPLTSVSLYGTVIPNLVPPGGTAPNGVVQVYTYGLNLYNYQGLTNIRVSTGLSATSQTNFQVCEYYEPGTQ